MTYNPFIRGEYPVGVRTIELTDEAGVEPAMITEIWYPATEDYRGKDLEESKMDRFKAADAFPEMTQKAVRDAESLDGRRPLILYFHGGYGFRLEAAEACTYLASHGFVVASPDFPGDNVKDMYSDNPAIKEKPIDESAMARPGQAKSAIDRIISGRYEFLSSIVDPDQIGTFGISMGGYTSLALNSIDGRQKASIPFAPMCGTRSPAPQVRRLSSLLRLNDWKSNVSTFIVAGGADALVIADDVHELYAKVPAPRRLAVLALAGHVHWADNAEIVHEVIRANYLSPDFADPELDGLAMAKAFRPFKELCSAEHAIDTMRAICLSHFEKHLKGIDEAAEFLENDITNTLTARGIDIEIASAQEMKAGV